MARLKAQKKVQLEKMQGCLTITRAFYQKHKTDIEAYVASNRAVTNPAPTSNKVQNTNLLTSKINAQMLITCEKSITDE